MASLYATWQQTHDLGTALGLDASRLPEQMRTQLQQLLATLPQAQAESILQQLHDQLADQAFGADQALRAFANVKAQVMGPQSATSGPVGQSSTQLALERSGVLTPPSQLTAATVAAPTSPDLSPSFAINPQDIPGEQQAGQPLTGTTPSSVQNASALLGSVGHQRLSGMQGPDTGAADLNTLAGYMGVSPQALQQQYQQYVSLVQRQSQRFAPTLRGEQAAAAQVMPIGDWVHSQLVGLEGSYAALLNAYDATYQATYGQVMPPELRASLRQAMLSAPPQARAQIDAVVAGGLSAMQQVPNIGTSSIASSVLPFLDTIVTSYAKAHPLASTEAAAQTQSYVQQFYQLFGRMPSAADTARFGTMSQQDFTDYINSQPYRNGLNYKNYTDTKSRFNSQWVSAFGKDLTDSQIASLSGMSDQEFTDWLNQQPSRVHGMNYGEFTGMHDALSKETQNEFGHDAPDELVKYFKEALSA